jgi:hypothetical protein
MSKRIVFLLLVVGALAVNPAGAIRVSFDRSLVGQWESPREILTFFASHEFKFGEEHGPVGRWSLQGNRLIFGIPQRGIRREAQILGVMPHQLTLFESGKTRVYERR